MKMIDHRGLEARVPAFLPLTTRQARVCYCDAFREAVRQYS